MPHVTLQISGHPDTELMHRAVAAVGDLTQRVLGKDAPVIATTITFIPREQWFIGGKPLSEHRTGRNAFQLDISVTDETNTKAEKAAFLQQAFEALSEVIGDVNEVSYIHVIDARAAAYGYGGKSQEFRHQHR
ncbi:MAG: 4-oxalocrotonate tautomerase [Cupriavidus sp.]|uniref:tautomerase family protein n=1 Tax=Cupriavidus pauculus TaxID=82633 RepID=UPI000C4DD600|nr:4-oxalocrotonate tautomerase [Cupriavidus pauculus]KAB0604405.1 4-oxalocrotonate tautomerase [Cupriavidus pauculus]MBU65004.1 4-oxalocrotonate tautomerase [Cupriavidus sp.]MCM3606728.1 4-oxalocrotonate tautomerase [Cupriavidus pauculus]UAL01553.1 4-oxalocrotonate tautomerase [Cupriavidus pauculus]